MIVVYVVLFIAAALLINSAVFYPLLIMLLSWFTKKKVSGQTFLPVSIIISAYNEKKVIRQRIENILSSSFDNTKIEILIGSDCSSDKTNEILKECQKLYPQLKIFLFTDRRGKAAVVNDLVKHATNPVLIFTDANSEFNKEAIALLSSGFCDERVGGVSGRLILSDEKVEKNESVEESKYWELETKIKIAEGKLGVLVGANGGIFAIRRELYHPVPLERAVTDDFYISMAVFKTGHIFRYNPKAEAREDVGSNAKAEFKRKSRFSATNYQTIPYLSDLLFNKNFLLSYAFWNHRIIRWFMPHLLCVLFICSGILSISSHWMFMFFAVQVFFLFLALLGFLLNISNKKISLFSIPYYFVLMNAAFLVGYFKFLRGRHTIIWQSTTRN